MAKWLGLKEKNKILLTVSLALFFCLLSPIAAHSEVVSVNETSTTRSISIKKFYIEIKTDTNAPIPMPRTDFAISYRVNDQSVLAYEGTTNENGEILDIRLENVPAEVTSLAIRYYLGNKERGYIQNLNNRIYSYAFSKGIPEDNVINYRSSTRFGNAGDEESYKYNYVAAHINYQYVLAVNDYVKAVQLANELLPRTARFELKPINFLFQRGEYLDQGNAFHRNGVVNKIPEIVFGDRSNYAKFQEGYIRHNVMHEWTHWNMYKEINMPGGGYVNHYTVNSNPQVSFKEGLALTTGELFTNRYNSDQDFANQNDSADGINRLFGKNTNKTVQGVLLDLVDLPSEGNDESYSLSRRMVEQEISVEDLALLNMGILHTAIIDSKATTLKDLLTYVNDRYVITRADEAAFKELLAVNGITETFDFMY